MLVCTILTSFFWEMEWKGMSTKAMQVNSVIFSNICLTVEFTHQQMHFCILKNTLKFPLKYA